MMEMFEFRYKQCRFLFNRSHSLINLITKTKYIFPFFFLFYEYESGQDLVYLHFSLFAIYMHLIFDKTCDSESVR